MLLVLNNLLLVKMIAICLYSVQLSNKFESF